MLRNGKSGNGLGVVVVKVVGVLMVVVVVVVVVVGSNVVVVTGRKVVATVVVCWIKFLAVWATAWAVALKAEAVDVVKGVGCAVGTLKLSEKNLIGCSFVLIII